MTRKVKARKLPSAADAMVGAIELLGEVRNRAAFAIDGSGNPNNYGPLKYRLTVAAYKLREELLSIARDLGLKDVARLTNKKRRD